MPNDFLTDDMKKFEPKLYEVCRTKFRTLAPTLKAACVTQARNHETIHLQIMRNMGNLTQNMRNIQVTSSLRGDMEAFALVNEWVDKWQTHGALVLAAVMTAAAGYDTILAARAGMSVAGSIFLDVALSFLPEIKGLERVFMRFVVPRRIAKLGDIRGIDLQKLVDVTNATVSKAQAIDRTSYDILQAVRGGLSQRSNGDNQFNLDNESQQLVNAYDAKNQVFRELLGNITSNLVSITNLASAYYFLIFNFPNSDVKSMISNFMKGHGFDPKLVSVPVTSDYAKLSDQILYDMLRAYVNKYFVVKAETSVAELPAQYNNLEGLDLSQRTMIYNRFGLGSQWRGTESRPNVSNYKDLYNKWRGSLVYLPPQISLNYMR